MRVVVYDETGEMTLDYDTRSDTLSLCPGRLEKAQVVESLQEAAFFVTPGPVPTPEGRNFRAPRFRGGPGRVTGPWQLFSPAL